MNHRDSPDMLLVANPASTNASRIDHEVIGPLRDARLNDPNSVLWTPDASYDGIVHAIGNRITEGSIVVVAGGDGLTNLAANAVHQSKVENVEMMMVPCGNACDIAHSVHGRTLSKPDGIIRTVLEGTAVPLSAIESVTDDSQSRIALGYLGVGVTAELSKLYSSPDYRATRPRSERLADLRDGLAMAWTFLTDKPFRYEEDGIMRQSHEILFSAIRNFAKKMKFDVEASEQKVIMTEFKHKYFLPTLLHRTVVEASRRGLRGHSFTNRSIKITDSDDTGASMQWDGEVEHVAPGTRINFQHLPAALTARVSQAQPSRHKNSR